MTKPFVAVLKALGCVAAAAVIAVFGVSLIRYGYQQYYSAVYPTKYVEDVTAASEEFGIAPSLIYAVIHTESNFEPQVTSSADAKGLMQITDETFEWALKRAGKQEQHTPKDLYEPSVNIRYGVYVLTLLEEQFDNTETVLAAYNAGLGRVSEWLKDPACSADGKHLDIIPYPETEEYVKRVLDAQKIYQQLYNIQ